VQHTYVTMWLRSQTFYEASRSKEAEHKLNFHFHTVPQVKTYGLFIFTLPHMFMAWYLI